MTDILIWTSIKVTNSRQALERVISIVLDRHRRISRVRIRKLVHFDSHIEPFREKLFGEYVLEQFLLSKTFSYTSHEKASHRKIYQNMLNT